MKPQLAVAALALALFAANAVPQPQNSGEIQYEYGSAAELLGAD